MNDGRRRWWRSSRTAGAVLLLASAIVSLAAGPSNSAAGFPLVTLSGGGSWAVGGSGPDSPIIVWQDALLGTGDDQRVYLNYLKHGTTLGREDVLAGNADFVISGVPFTADELTGAKKTAADFIDAPVLVSSLAFVFSPPWQGGFTWVSYKCDPDTADDPAPCFVRTAYNDPSKPVDANNPPVKVLSRNLAAMALVDTAPDPDPKAAGASLAMWRDPDVLAQFGNLPANSSPDIPQPPFFSFSPNAAPTTINRSDGDEVNLYLQQFVKKAAFGDVWTRFVKGADSTADPSTWPITERLPHLAGTVSRDGAEQQVGQLGLNGADPTTGTLLSTVQGVFAPAPSWTLADVKNKFKNQKFEVIYLKNANGDWVAPTSDSITAAIAAGGDTPLFALDHSVANAYPLAWVDHLYAPAHGLSLEKTEGLAASIRYLATAGQDAMATVGEGRLSKDLVAKALAAADQLVQSNCTAADQEVVKSTDPGPYAPDLPALKGIGSMLHCQKKTEPTTTTTTAAPTTTTTTTIAAPTTSLGPLTTTPLPSSNAFSSSDTTVPLAALSPPPSASASDVAQTAASANSATPTRNITGALTAARLPLPAPLGSRRGTTLATLMLGAALYLLLIRPLLRSTIRRARS